MKTSLGIYVHIPFCVKKCDYCDFLSMRADDKEKEDYVTALLDEIKAYGGMLSDYVVDTIYFGGGTPSILDTFLTKKIMDAIRCNFDISKDAEISIECNPGTVTYEKTEAYRNIGINRISFGLQSANDNELKAIGRIHSYEQFLESYDYAKKAGFKNINVDLMEGLASQTIKSYSATLKKVCVLNPAHISAYSLILEEGTPLYNRVYEARSRGIEILPDDDVEASMYELSSKLLQKNGYMRYEVSNYAKTGFECRHNIRYWKRGEYIGFGIGASSLIKNVRHTNTSDIKNYIENAGKTNKIVAKSEKLSIKDQMEEYMFLGLRMVEGVSIKKFHDEFGKKIDEVYAKVFENLRGKGLIESRGDMVRLTPRGMDIGNVVLAEFLL